MTKNIILHHIVPGIIFGALILLFSVSMAVSRTQPQIMEISPSRVSPGDLMVLEGRNFGDSRNKSKVYLDDAPLTASFIESWTDTTVNVRVPPVKTSGLISVETGGGRSRGALFILSERIPDLAPGAFLPGRPYLSGINNSRFLPGEMVILQGDKLGMRTKNSRILVSLSGEAPGNVLDQPDEEDYYAVPDDHIYSWENERLAFFLPQEARSGPVYVHTASGYSNPVSIDVPEKDILYSSPRRVSLKQRVGLSGVAAFPGNALALWYPLAEESGRQRILDLSTNFTRDSQPLVLKELGSLEDKEFTAEYELELRSMVCTYDPADYPSVYGNGDMLGIWLEHEEDLPAQDFRRTALAVVKREKNPYKMSKLIFDYVLWKMAYDEEDPAVDPSEWLETRRTDDLGYASLFVCLNRSVGIPSRVVSGLWLPGEGEEAVVHHWAEVYLPGYGWYPADPGAADGVLDAWLEDGEEKPGSWGRLDNRYATFSRGRESGSTLFHQNRSLGDCSYSRQEQYGELMGNLDSARLTYYLPEVLSRL